MTTYPPWSECVRQRSDGLRCPSYILWRDQESEPADVADPNSLTSLDRRPATLDLGMPQLTPNSNEAGRSQPLFGNAQGSNHPTHIRPLSAGAVVRMPREGKKNHIFGHPQTHKTPYEPPRKIHPPPNKDQDQNQDDQCWQLVEHVAHNDWSRPCPPIHASANGKKAAATLTLYSPLS